MLKILFTTDHEIHGNGDGSPRDLLIETTNRTLRLFDKFGAKLTILADTAEILKFGEYYQKTGNDFFCYQGVVKQLKHAISAGHDVQLHVHSSYCNSEYKDGRWVQDYSEYNLAALSIERISTILEEGKTFLESLLREVDPRYRCFVFRAACWSMYPTSAIATALKDCGFIIDTSVFKWGRRDNGLVQFDYSTAQSDLIPWQFNINDVCSRAHDSGLFEFPIFSEMKPLWGYFSLNRLYRALLSHRHNMLSETAFKVACRGAEKKRLSDRIFRITNILWRKQVRKMDYNQCSGKQLIRTLREIERRYGTDPRILPVVLIGHSKLFSRVNEWSLEPFLAFIKNNPDRYSFGTFRDFDLSTFA